jgi:hypothetical protein
MNLNAVKGNGEAIQTVAKFGQPGRIRPYSRPHLVSNRQSATSGGRSTAAMPALFLLGNGQGWRFAAQICELRAPLRGGVGKRTSSPVVLRIASRHRAA